MVLVIINQRGDYGANYLHQILIMEYVTISTQGNGANFGNLIFNKKRCWWSSNAVRGIFGLVDINHQQQVITMIM